MYFTAYWHTLLSPGLILNMASESTSVAPNMVPFSAIHGVILLQASEHRSHPAEQYILPLYRPAVIIGRLPQTMCSEWAGHGKCFTTADNSDADVQRVFLRGETFKYVSRDMLTITYDGVTGTHIVENSKHGTTMQHNGKPMITDVMNPLKAGNQVHMKPWLKVTFWPVSLDSPAPEVSETPRSTGASTTPGAGDKRRRFTPAQYIEQIIPIVAEFDKPTFTVSDVVKAWQEHEPERNTQYLSKRLRQVLDDACAEGKLAKVESPGRAKLFRLASSATQGAADVAQ